VRRSYIHQAESRWSETHVEKRNQALHLLLSGTLCDLAVQDAVMEPRYRRVGLRTSNEMCMMDSLVFLNPVVIEV